MQVIGPSLGGWAATTQPTVGEGLASAMMLRGGLALGAALFVAAVGCCAQRRRAAAARRKTGSPTAARRPEARDRWRS